MRFGKCLAAVAAMVCLAAGGAAAAPPPPVPADLVQKAIGAGSVRVVVHLRVGEGADPAAIESVKRALLNELAGTRYRVVRQLAGLPVLALEASAETLGALGASPRVQRVIEEQPRRPQR